MNQSDHDLLQQIANDVKHISSWTHNHEKVDEVRYKEQQSQNKVYNRVIWLGGGILLAVQVLFKLIN